TSDKPMFQLDGKKYTQQQFATYLKENFREGNKYPLEGIARELFADWTNETALELEKSKLLTKYPEYKALMDEYHDGILLYEVMSDKVWNKTMSDSSGLEAYYEANKSNYMWAERVDAVIYETVSTDIAQKVQDLLKKGI